jgi:hypothetical protein
VSKVTIIKISVWGLCVVEQSENHPNIEKNRQHPLLWPEDNTANNHSLINLKTPATKKICVPEEYSTIQEAIDATMPGDTIEVASGTYNKNISGKAQYIVQFFDDKII